MLFYHDTFNDSHNILVMNIFIIKREEKNYMGIRQNTTVFAMRKSEKPGTKSEK